MYFRKTYETTVAEFFFFFYPTAFDKYVHGRYCASLCNNKRHVFRIASRIVTRAGLTRRARAEDPGSLEMLKFNVFCFCLFRWNQWKIVFGICGSLCLQECLKSPLPFISRRIRVKGTVTFPRYTETPTTCFSVLRGPPGKKFCRSRFPSWSALQRNTSTTTIMITTTKRRTFLIF